MKKLNELINHVLKDANYLNNPYFIALKNKEMSKEEFIKTQKHFYYAVEFFSRPMSAVAAKIPDPELRIEIIRNVWEEHGDGNVSHLHGATFRELLHRLQPGTALNLENEALSPDVRLFNTALTGVSVMDEFTVSVACFGIIERMFVDISAFIGEAILDNQWLESEQLIHYSLHKELDIKHSQDFFDVLEHYFSENSYQITQGLMMGATMFYNLYLGLYTNRNKLYK